MEKLYAFNYHNTRIVFREIINLIKLPLNDSVIVSDTFRHIELIYNLMYNVFYHYYMNINGE